MSSNEEKQFLTFSVKELPLISMVIVYQEEADSCIWRVEDAGEWVGQQGV